MTTAEAAEPYRHAFKNGIVVEINAVQKVALALFRTAVDKKYPQPAPPVDTTDLGDVENRAHPDYLAAVEKWEQQQRNRAQLHMLRFSVKFDQEQVDRDMARLEADRQRIADHLAAFDMEPSTLDELDEDAQIVAEVNDKTNRIRWLYWIACQADPIELIELINAIIDISDQEGQIKAAQATFPG